jgi:hypothetical protein
VNANSIPFSKIVSGDQSSREDYHVPKYQREYTWGNNSKLATATFSKKQELAEGRKFLVHDINIGYRNGLALNDPPFKVGGKSLNLATAPEWTAQMIEARTSCMVDSLLEMSTFEGVD